MATLLFTFGCGTGSGNGGSGGGNGGGSQDQLNKSVNHIIFMIQENRSFDNYFGQINSYRKSKGMPDDVDAMDKLNPAPSNPMRTPDTGTLTVFPMTSVCEENVSPAWNESHRQRNVQDPNMTSPANMDGFVYTAAGYARNNGYYDTSGKRAMGYYTEKQIPYYYYMATQFATSDRWFSPVMSKSEPNRLYSFAATSAGWIKVPNTTLTQKTIFHLLQNAGVSWKVYTTDTGKTFLSYFQPFASQNADKIVPLDEYYSDLKNGTLPSVAFIEPGSHSGLDEHPNTNIQLGAAAVARIINALMNSSSWQDSVFFLTYDEGGGLYDHVPPIPTVAPDNIPPMLDAEHTSDFGDQFTYTGFRVPLIVVSPFTKKGYVSHTNADYTAILKFIETRFNLPNLTARDQAQPSMLEYFDFQGVPWKNPPNPPNQPTSAPCYYNAVP